MFFEGSEGGRPALKSGGGNACGAATDVGGVLGEGLGSGFGFAGPLSFACEPPKGFVFERRHEARHGRRGGLDRGHGHARS